MTASSIDHQFETSAEEKPSYRSVAKHRPVQVVALSQFLSQMARQTIAYGIMVFLAAAGASSSSVAGKRATYLAALLFGLHGRAGGRFPAEAPDPHGGFFHPGGDLFRHAVFFWHHVGALLQLIFLTSAIGQIIIPGMQSIVAIVATPAELATASALIKSIIGSVGSATVLRSRRQR